MAVQKRLALTISPDYLDLLKKVADYQKIPVSTMVLEALLKTFQDVEAGGEKEKILSEFLADAFEGVGKSLRDK